MQLTRKQFLSLLATMTIVPSRFLGKNQEDGKKAVESFLSEWLVRRRVKSAMKFFHSKAFTSKLILSDSCIGELGDADRNKPDKVRVAVEKFLREVLKWVKGDSFGEILKTFKPTDDELKSVKLLSSPEKDGYLLASGKSLEAETDKDWEYLKSLFPSEEYLYLASMLRIHGEKEEVEAPIYSIWARENGAWRIIHFGLGCI